MEWDPRVWYSDGREFLLEVRAEFRKVTWPTFQEARAGTIGVLIVVGVLTLTLTAVDYGLSWAIQLVIPS